MRSNVLRFVIVIVTLLAVYFSKDVLSETTCATLTPNNLQQQGVINGDWWSLKFTNIQGTVSLLQVKETDSQSNGQCTVYYSCGGPIKLKHKNNRTYYIKFKVVSTDPTQTCYYVAKVQTTQSMGNKKVTVQEIQTTDTIPQGACADVCTTDPTITTSN